MKAEISLNNYFVFNSSYGTQEGEEINKILYYFPNNEDSEVKIKNVGLVEAIIQFTGTFKPSSPANSLRTQKKRQLYFQPEEGTWIVITLNTPFNEVTKDGIVTKEYTENDIQDNVYEAVLKQSYEMYKLFNGKFSTTLERSGISGLKTKLQKFYDTYLKTIKLNHCDILNIFNGIHFLPLDTQNFLNVQCFVNELECNYPIISHTLFMYNEHVIWSGIASDEIQTLYQYLVTILLPTCLQNELQGGSMTRNPSSPFTPIYHGRFVNFIMNAQSSENMKIPKVILTKNDKLVNYYMLIFRILSSSICLFIEDAKDVTMQMLKEIEEFMSSRLVPVVSEIGEYCAQQNVTVEKTENTPKFIYFNKVNLACKSTAHLFNNQTGNLACSRECLKIMSDMHARKDEMENVGEITVKTMNDYWIVGKNSHSREFYVTIQQKDANLKDISAEVKKLCDSQLKGIFFNEL